MKKPDGIDIFMIVFFIASTVAFLIYKHYEVENKRLEEEYIRTLSKNDIINIQLKRFFKDLHHLDNFEKKELDWVKDIKNFKGDFEHWAISNFKACSGATKPDNRCEFWKYDKKLNYEYLLNLGARICNESASLSSASKIIAKEALLKKELYYPWDEDTLLDENGNLKYLIVYYSDFKKDIKVFSDVFLSEDEKDILLVTHYLFEYLFLEVFEDRPYNFCIKHDYIMKNKNKKNKAMYPNYYNFDESSKYIFTTIPFQYNTNLDYKTIYYNKNTYEMGKNYRNIFDQYKNIKWYTKF